jgi:hypothetical protein
MLGGGVVRAEVPGLPPHALALAHAGADHDFTNPDSAPARTPAPGEPVLLVYSLGHDTERPALDRVSAVRNRRGDLGYSDRLVVSRHATDAVFRIALVPHRAGEPIPDQDQLAALLNTVP